MELLLEIDESMAGAGQTRGPGVREQIYRIRKAARAVLLNGQGRVALLHVTRMGYHKLPGGGVEEGEDLPLALAREVREEAGVAMEVQGEVGMTVEYRKDHGLLQFSSCYYGAVTGDAGGTDFTEEEREAGFRLIWVPLEEAADLLERDRPEDYMGRFIRVRDLTLLRRAEQILGERA